MTDKEIMVPENNFLALKDFNLAEVMSTEMAGLELTFDRISVPAAGGQVFEVPGEMPGETDMVKDFSGVILFHHPMFGYYREKYTGGKNAPDCSSYDGITGVGNPGGACIHCPLKEFGSGENGGKACKDKRRVYILRQGELIPVILTLPATSIRNLTVYLKQILAKGIKPAGVVTKFSLQKATSSGGVAYSQVHFSVERFLSAEERAYIDLMAEQIKAFATRVEYDEEPALVVDPATGEVFDPDNPFT